MPVSALRNRENEAVYNGWIDKFNPIQTQVFNALYNMNDNVFVEVSGKTVCAKFALFRLWSQPNNGRCIYIAPFQEVVDQCPVDESKVKCSDRSILIGSDVGPTYEMIVSWMSYIAHQMIKQRIKFVLYV